MGYIDLHSHLFPEKDIIRRYKEFGWNGFVYLYNFKSMEELLEIKRKISEIGSDAFHIYLGVEITADEPRVLRNIVNKVREEVVIVAVHGGKYEINREAVSNPKVDILLHPELERNDNGLDENLLKLAKENSVAIEVNFREILSNKGLHRVKIIQNISENIRLCQELNVDMVTTTGAKDIWDIRDPRALASLSNVLGMDLGKAIDTVSEIPENIINTNLKILEGKRPDKGIEVIE